MSDTIWSTQVLPSGQEELRIPGFRLVVVKGPDKGRQVESASTTELSVGTANGSDLRLSDPTISRNHLVLEATREGFRLRDLGSTNGSYVNGVKVIEAYVPPDVEISIGASVVRFQQLPQFQSLSLHPNESFGSLLGRSVVMRQTFAKLSRAAQSNTNLLLLGETGTGKDLAAEAVHLSSDRRDRPFVIVDCGALSENLVETELFGHQRGAFTGADADRIGAFEMADQGVVFLDEVGELPLTLQVKLLRVLERKTVRRVGDSLDRRVDVRIIAATHRDLRQEVNRGAFREDLFFRLSILVVKIPPLRDREDDVILLAEHFLQQMGAADRLSQGLRARLHSHRWPGNVRELRNLLETVVALGDVPLPDSEEVALDFKPDVSIPFKQAKREMVRGFERTFLKALLEHTKGNVSAAARTTKLDRMHLLKLLRQTGLR